VGVGDRGVDVVGVRLAVTKGVGETGQLVGVRGLLAEGLFAGSAASHDQESVVQVWYGERGGGGRGVGAGHGPGHGPALRVHVPCAVAGHVTGIREHHAHRGIDGGRANRGLGGDDFRLAVDPATELAGRVEDVAAQVHGRPAAQVRGPARVVARWRRSGREEVDPPDLTERAAGDQLTQPEVDRVMDVVEALEYPSGGCLGGLLDRARLLDVARQRLLGQDMLVRRRAAMFQWACRELTSAL
jgi:hypothetical protein